MELRHLQTFATAAELQSFTRAAETLSLTQAAVSQHVAALEKELKIALFDRSGRTAVPTAAGRTLHEYARRILDLVEEAAREVGQAAAIVRGVLRIAASSVPAETLLPDLLVRFRQLHPDVREAVTVTDSAAATRAVEAGEAEIGLTGELPRSTRLAARPLATDELVLVVRPDNPLVRTSEVALDRLRTEPLIVREPGSGSRRCIEQALEAAGLPPGELNIVMETNSSDAIRSAVERGIGSAFLSRTLIERDVAAGRLAALRIRNVRAERKLYLLTDPDRLSTPAVRAFLQFVQADRLTA